MSRLRRREGPVVVSAELDACMIPWFGPKLDLEFREREKVEFDSPEQKIYVVFIANLFP